MAAMVTEEQRGHNGTNKGNILCVCACVCLKELTIEVHKECRTHPTVCRCRLLGSLIKILHKL